MVEVNPIIKEVTTDCNLRCKYCFFAKQDRRRSRVSTTTLETIVRKICDCNPKSKEIMFYWHGGEPLLAGIDFYKQAIEFQRKFKKPGQKIRNGLETNATLLNNKWADFFTKTGFGVGVSLDGPKEYHDVYRQYPNGKGSFDEVIKGVEILQRNGIEFSVISVITKKSVLAPEEMFGFFCSKKISNFVNFVPSLGIETGHGLSFEYSIQPASYIDFLISVFDLWINGDRPELKILPLESIVRAFLGFAQEDCRFAGECLKSIVIEYNGDIFACNTYGYGDFFKFGNIEDGIDAIFDPQSSPKYKNYLDFLGKIKKDCLDCKWYKICHGGCPGWYYLGKGKNILCQDFKRLFAYIQKTLKEYKMI